MQFIEGESGSPLTEREDLARRAEAPLFFINARSHSSGKDVRLHIGKLMRREVSL